MIIKCTCPERSVVQIKDVVFERKGKPSILTLKKGDLAELAETDAVVQSRFSGEIHRLEQKGWLTVVSEPVKTMFSPAT